MITDVPGVRVGHWTDEQARTGCTVVLLPDGTVGSGEVRGGAPATREFELLAPHRTVTRLDAIVFSGGSAFGLAACDGVMRFCEERGMGFPTEGGVVPIVVGAALFDLLEGVGSVRPGPAEGYAACEAATAGSMPVGRVGAGTGATVGSRQSVPHKRGRASARSSTRRASGPICQMESSSPPGGRKWPVRGVRPVVGLIPAMPQKCAGRRMLPPASLPRPRGDMPEAMAAASPPDEPPGVRARSYGFFV